VSKRLQPKTVLEAKKGTFGFVTPFIGEDDKYHITLDDSGKITFSEDLFQASSIALSVTEPGKSKRTKIVLAPSMKATLNQIFIIDVLDNPIIKKNLEKNTIDFVWEAFVQGKKKTRWILVSSMKLVIL
jgi:hypothetical protein